MGSPAAVRVEYAPWRRKYFDERMKEMRGAQAAQEDEPEARSTAAEASEPEAPERGRADSGTESEAKRYRSAGVDGLLPEAQRGVPCVCRHCDGGLGIRNLMFKLLKELGLEKHDPLGLLRDRLPALTKAGGLGLHSNSSTDRVAQPSRNPRSRGQT